MAGFVPNVDPVFLIPRKGTEESPYLPLKEDKVVYKTAEKYTVTLSEIPSFNNKVKVKGVDGKFLTEIFDFNAPLSSTQFYVDYTSGVVYFHSSNEQKQFNFDYLGMGNINFPSSRIVMQGGTKTLQDLAKDLENSKTNWLYPPLPDLVAVQSTYPTPKIGDTISTTNQGIVYRYEPRGWIPTQQISDNAVTDLQFKADDLLDRTNELENTSDQLTNSVGDIKQLKTDDKSNLTAATNEIAEQVSTKAEQSQLDSSSFADVYVSEHRDLISDSIYRLVNIPHKDNKGTVNILKRGFGKDSPNGGVFETAREFSLRKKSTVTINASVWNTNTNLYYGVQIYNGEIISDTVHYWRWTLGIKSNNQLTAYEPGVTARQILDDGCDNALTGFIPLILNGASVSQSIKDGYTDATKKYTRQVIAQKTNSDILVFTCDGIADSKGMTVDDVIRVLLSFGDISFAFHLDGGGSTQTVVRNRLINQVTDGGGYTERPVPDFLYVASDTDTFDSRNQQTYRITTDLSTVAKKSLDASIELKNLSAKIEANVSLLDTFGKFTKNTTRGTNANSIINSGLYWFTASAIGIPTNDASYGIFHLNYDEDNALQMALSFQTSAKLRVRRKREGAWEDWGSIS